MRPADLSNVLLNGWLGEGWPTKQRRETMKVHELIATLENARAGAEVYMDCLLIKDTRWLVTSVGVDTEGDVILFDDNEDRTN